MDIYNVLAVPALRSAAFFLKIFDKKFAEREREWRKALGKLDQIPKKKSFRVWFHAASMGEFEQAKPVIERLKKNSPEIQIIVSFFSPSGYRTQKNYSFADAILYMPLDTKENAKLFIEKISPDLAVFIRYELWYNHIATLREKNIPAFLVCATLGEIKILNFSPTKNFKRKIYSIFEKIFPLNSREFEKFSSLKISSEIQQISDTRFDRIAEKVQEAHTIKILPPQFDFNEDFVVVLGSSWEQDEEIFSDVLTRIDSEKRFSVRLIIVPHEPTQEHISHSKKIFPDSLLLSEILSDEKIPHKRHIIVDSIGKLLSLYSYADAAYVGGGFGTGVHSLAEPAAYGVPLVCGEKIQRSPDAPELLQKNALTVIKNSTELYDWLVKFIAEDESRSRAGKAAASYIFDSLGSSELIAEKILTRLKKN